MLIYRRALLIGASAVVAFGTLAACSTDNETKPHAFPQSASYIADVPGVHGRTVTIGLTVKGDDVAAYTCDGATDEAWFFGTENDGSLDLTGKFADHLTAAFDGTKINGTLTLDDANYQFSAVPVSAPAGVYTAAAGGARSSWIVRPDHTFTGVLSANSKRDREVIDQIDAQQADFKAQIKARRIARQLVQASELHVGSWQSTINGTPVVATAVNGDSRF
jgi:hypothetical protein